MKKTTQQQPKNSKTAARKQEKNEPRPAGKKKKVLVILPLLMIAVAAVVLVVGLRLRKDGAEDASKAAGDVNPEITAQTDDGKKEGGKTVQAGETNDEDNSGDGDAGGAVLKNLEDDIPALSVSEAVNYMMTLPPQMLGLSGTTMAEYQIYPSTSVVHVNGIPCSLISVYSTGPDSGTNDIAGDYCLSRGEVRRIFRVNRNTDEVTEVTLPGVETAEETEENTGENKGENKEDEKS